MIKVFVNRLPIDAPWGGGNNWVVAFNTYAKELGIEVVHDLRGQNVDAIVIAGFDAGNSGVDFYRALNICSASKTKLIVRINENDARKGTTGVDRTMWSMINLSSGTIFVSHWLQHYYAQQFKTAPNSQCAIVYNGVNKNHFFDAKYQNLTQNPKLRIVAHHWSNNLLKGFDIYDAIDAFCDNRDDVVFEYIGRHNNNFKGKNTKVIEPLHGLELGNALRGGNGMGMYKKNVYVSGSRFDPGPNHVLESLACGFSTWAHKDGGGAVEFVGADHVYDNVEALLEMIDKDDPKLLTPNTYTLLDWYQSISYYCDFIKKIVSGV